MTKRSIVTDCQRKSMNESARRTRRRFTEWLHGLKSVPCADCGGRFDPVCMDFDHRPGTVKLFHIGKNTHSEDAVLAEIAKCDVVCANCHRVRTFRTREHAASCTRAVREQRALAATKQLELGEAGKRVVEENRR